MSRDSFKFIHLKTYCSHKQLADNRKKYCRVFDQARTKSIFCQLVFKNTRCGIDNWVAKINIKWIRIGYLREETVVYTRSVSKLIELDKEIVEWEEDTTGIPGNTFLPGAYFISAAIDGLGIESPDFYIMGYGEMSLVYNPYFKIEKIHLFKEKREDMGLVKKGLYQFDPYDTTLITLQLQLRKKITDADWYCEMFACCYTEDGELKERHTVFQLVEEGEGMFLMSFTLGSGDLYYWEAGNYKLQFTFLGIIVAECYFSCGERDIEGNVYVEMDPRIIAKSDEVENTKRKPVQFTYISEPDEKDCFPEQIDDKSAVRLAYGEELSRITSYITNGLSVLIVCDKIMTEFIYQEVCRRAGKSPIQDNLNFDTKDFVSRIQSISEGEVLILRSFEILMDWTMGSSIIFQTDTNGNLPQILAFCDTSIPVKEVLVRRFALLVRILGIPREIEINKNKHNPLSFLITRKERDLFKNFNPNEIYKHISGLNILQFRNAFKYIQTTFKEPVDSEEIYKALRVFKQHTHKNDVEFTATSFDDIGGYEEVKQLIGLSLSLFQRSEENLPKEQQIDAVPKGFILYGLPGTGKTMFAKAIANKLNATVQMISGPEIVEMWVGKSEENLRNIFATARRNAPSVILFDEFDSIARKRSNISSGGAMVANSLMAQLLTELDGFRPNDGVLVIATTNRIQDIDVALMRPSRLRRIFIDLPDLDARREVARLHGKHYKIDRIVEDTLLICSRHFESWKTSSPDAGGRRVPEAFFEDIRTTFPSFEKRMKKEVFDKMVHVEVLSFFGFMHDLEEEKTKNGQDIELVRSISKRFARVRQTLGVEKEKNIEEYTKKTTLEKDFEDMYLLLQAELSEESIFMPKDYFKFLIDLIAEFTDGWNNDQIGNLFKEAAIAHSLEGKLLSPKYFGEQIGKIKANKETVM